MTLDFLRLGKPTDDAFIEMFNNSYWAECLKACWLLSLEDVQSKCDAWGSDYNEQVPHSSIVQKTPVEFTRASGQPWLLRGAKVECFSLQVVNRFGAISIVNSVTFEMDLQWVTVRAKWFWYRDAASAGVRLDTLRAAHASLADNSPRARRNSILRDESVLLGVLMQQCVQIVSGGKQTNV